MSKHWQRAIKFGILWGIFMAVFTILFDLQHHTLTEITRSNGFWLKSLGYTLIGIFPVGYFTTRNPKE